MINESKVNIEDLNKKLRKHILLHKAYSFLNDHKRVKVHRDIILEIENKIILAKLKQAK